MGDPSAAPDLQNNSKTIQMLLQLQGSNPSLETAERARRADLPDLPNGVRQAKPSSKADSPFGAGQNPFGGGLDGKRSNGIYTAKPETVEWNDGGGARGGGVTYGTGAANGRDAYRPGGTTDEAPDVDVRSWLPTSLMRFLRKNRETVLGGGLALLALVGLGAASASKKR